MPCRANQTPPHQPRLWLKPLHKVCCPRLSAEHALRQHMHVPQPAGLQPSDMLAVSPSCACGRPHEHMLSLS